MWAATRRKPALGLVTVPLSQQSNLWVYHNNDINRLRLPVNMKLHKFTLCLCGGPNAICQYLIDVLAAVKYGRW